jgi:hypothetical protein
MFSHSAQISDLKEKSPTVLPLMSNGAQDTSQTPQKTQGNEHRAQLPDASESVRQMLQDEMFKLVQVSMCLCK